MSLFGLSTAVADLKEGKHGTGSTAADPAQHSNEAAVQLELQRMAAALKACQQAVKQNSHGHPIPDPLESVQQGLHDTQQQLQHILQQQHNNSFKAAQKSAKHHAVNKQQQGQRDGTCAVLVLQNLLQLAVGDVCALAGTSDSWHVAQHNTDGIALSTTSEPDTDSMKSATHAPTLIGPCWHFGTLQRTARQQQAWEHAGLQAVQLFDLQELLAESSETLHQALLLRPQLLDQMLEVIVAAVLRPGGQNHAAQGGTYKQCRGQSADPNSTNTSSSSCNSSKGACRIKCSSVATTLADSKLPWSALPEVLATSPPLMLKASATLISWLEATGHQQLWHLSSLILRPAWQRMAFAAAATADPHSITGQCAADRSSFCDSDMSPGFQISSSTPTDKSSSCQRALAGAFQLVCPDGWQQQLVLQLVQETSADELAKLLQLLPRLAIAGESCYREPAVKQALNTLDTLEDDAAESESWPSCDQWNSSWQQQQRQRQHRQCYTSQQQQHNAQKQQQQLLHAETADAIAGTSSIAVAVCNMQQDSDLLTVLAAWRLVIQHRCWYEFACHLLVQCSSTLLQSLQQQQLEQQQLPGSARASLTGVQCASAFLAWVQEPVDTHRQHQLQQLLLQPVNRTASAQGAAEISSDAVATASSTCMLDISRHLLQCWRSAMLGTGGCTHCIQTHTTVAGAATVHADPGCHVDCKHHYTSSCSLPLKGSEDGASGWRCLMAVDLAVAVLQQLPLLTQCEAHELMQLCFPKVIAGLQQQQQQHAPKAATAAESSQPMETCLQPEQQQDRIFYSSMLCAAVTAVDTVSAAAVEFFNAALKCNTQLMALHAQGPTGQQQPKQQQPICGHWLPRQWVAQVAATGAQLGLQHGLAGSNSAAPWMLVARKLLESSTACDKLLKPP